MAKKYSILHGSDLITNEAVNIWGKTFLFSETNKIVKKNIKNTHQFVVPQLGVHPRPLPRGGLRGEGSPPRQFTPAGILGEVWGSWGQRTELINNSPAIQEKYLINFVKSNQILIYTFQ